MTRRLMAMFACVGALCVASVGFAQEPEPKEPDSTATTIADEANIPKTAESLADDVVEAAKKSQPTTQPTTGTQQPSSAPVHTAAPKADTLPTSMPVNVESDYVLAIDPELIPPNVMEPSGTPITERRLKPSIGQERKTTFWEGAAWVPRVVFFPVFLVFEYGIRWPLEQLTVWVEKNHILAKVQHAFSFDNGNGRIIPRIQLLGGFTASVGLGVVWENMIFEGNDWAIGADAGLNRNATIDFGTRFRFFDDIVKLGFDYRLEQRNDFVFYGIGSETTEDDETRFFRRKNTGIASLNIARLPSGFGARTSVEVSDYHFECSDGDSDICGPDHIANNDDDLADIDGDGVDGASFFSEGYTLLRLKGLLYFDSREQRPGSGTGIRLEAFGRIGQGLDPTNIDFVRYGGEIAGFWDFYRQRVIGLRVRAELANPIGDGEIPFGELITMGGREVMRGFGTARFHGRSAFLSTLEYRYPVWSFLDANLYFEVGNTFDEDFDDFELGALRPSLGLALRTVGNRYSSLDIYIALGGTRFDADTFKIDSIGIGLGTNWGF